MKWGTALALATMFAMGCGSGASAFGERHLSGPPGVLVEVNKKETVARQQGDGKPGEDPAPAKAKSKAGAPAAKPDPGAKPEPVAPAAQPSTAAPKENPTTKPEAPKPEPPKAETIEVDVSTRTVAVTSQFSGTEIVVFGSVDNSRQESAESGYYDVVVVVEGATAPVVVRRKSRVLGMWVNTDEMQFETLPLYRAVASTRPLDEIAEPRILSNLGVNLDRVIRGPTGTAKSIAFGGAAIRLKQRDGLYVGQDFGVAFIGRTLFRAGVKLPANIPVGPLDVRVLLFKDGRMLATRTANVRLERQGLERLIYDFAYEYPFWYGVLAVAMAAGAGLAAAAFFNRQTA